MALRRLNPPLHLLRAFTEVVRFGSVSRAAEALHLTQSAVSKQVQELERWIGVNLFERSHKRLTLTTAGEHYNRAIVAVLAGLESATLEAISSQTEGGTLNLSVFPTFGAKWLIPRLPDFQRKHPQITLRFVPHIHAFDLQRSDLDCSIVFGDGNLPDTNCHYIDGRDVVIIAPPTESARPADDVASFLRQGTLLHHVAVPDAWLQWQEHHGIAGFDALVGPRFDQFESMIRAVSVGLGLALVPRCLVRDELAAGVVSEGFPDSPLGGYQSHSGYWLCYTGARSRMPQLMAFRAWLLDDARRVAAAS
ncbi:DNA-binding transcriptional regulator, LysR family [Cupriavidus sp. YR651]|uniref:LysR substrate-binding domain-containing protein n=1 Tax=Cupriavidus sp. YR651 TaxID=1855315 RepID=UPI00088864BA|nr:LysR substrate-binding domain-containing protein [Cupriavidus sp. YR651]SDD92847.1 DNA-binding transcriptional regulator, LysR family [Cupriavidus sp. YR651]